MHEQATIICIKWGTKYPAYYVNRLYGGVSRSMDRPFRFVCYTDDSEGIRGEVECFPLPIPPFERQLAEAQRTHVGGQWRKITVIQPGEAKLSAPCLFLDLDVAITGALGPLLDFAPGKFCMARRWIRPRLRKWIREIRHGRIIEGQGAVFTFDPVAHGYIVDEFAADIKGVIEAHKGEQEFTSRTAYRRGDLRHFPDSWIRSYKIHSLPTFPLNLLVPPSLPGDSRVLCFHVAPTMDEAMTGARGGKLRHRSRPALWLEEAWRE